MAAGIINVQDILKATVQGAQSALSAKGSPSQNVESWNTLTIEGDRVPGFVEFPHFTVERRIDEKESPGSDAFALTDKGAKCSDVDFTFILMDADVGPFDDIYQRHINPRAPLMDRKTRKANVKTVVHPSLYRAGIRQVYFFSATGIQPTSFGGVGTYKMTVKGKEFTARTKIGTGDGSRKVKADTSRIAQAAKWAKQEEEAEGTYVQIDGGPLQRVDASGNPIDPNAPQPGPPPKAQSQTAMRRNAAGGNANAKFTRDATDRAATLW